MNHTDHIAELEHQIATLIVYAQVKLSSSDWHALSDVANDLRELEAALSVYKSLTKTGGGGTMGVTDDRPE